MQKALLFEKICQILNTAKINNLKFIKIIFLNEFTFEKEYMQIYKQYTFQEGIKIENKQKIWYIFGTQYSVHKICVPNHFKK